MDNLARETKETKATEIKLNDIPGRRVEFVNLSKERPGNWQYVDVDKLESRIRAEETAKWVTIRKREREIKKLRKEAFWSTILATLAIRIVGVVIIFAGTSAALYWHLGEAALVSWPLGALFIICPGHNSISKEMDEYIRRKKNDR